MKTIKHILQESVRQVLMEQTAIQKVQKELANNNKRYQHAFDFLSTFKPMTVEKFASALCELDGSSEGHEYFDENAKTGVYFDWVVTHIEEFMQLIQQHESDAMEMLTIFHEFKKKLPSMGLSANIWDYTPETLFEKVQLLNNTEYSMSFFNQLNKLKGQFDVVYETSEYVIVKIKTYNAEIFFGSRTSWCTVGNKSFFDKYSPHYYVVIPKKEEGRWDIKSRNRYQFHLNYDEYDDYFEYYVCDVEDNKVYIDDLPYDLPNVAAELMDNDHRIEMEWYNKRLQNTMKMVFPIIQPLTSRYANIKLFNNQMEVYSPDDMEMQWNSDGYGAITFHTDYMSIYSEDMQEDAYGEIGSLENDMKYMKAFVQAAMEAPQGSFVEMDEFKLVLRDKDGNCTDRFELWRWTNSSLY